MSGGTQESDPEALLVGAALGRVELARQMGLLAAFGCPACGCPSLASRGNYDICTVCFWEDDGPIALDEPSGPNAGYTLRQAIRNVVHHGLVYDELDWNTPEELLGPRLAISRFAAMSALRALVAAPDDAQFRRSAADLREQVEHFRSAWERSVQPVAPAAVPSRLILSFFLRWSRSGDEATYGSGKLRYVTSLCTLTISGRNGWSVAGTARWFGWSTWSVGPWSRQ